MAANRSRLQPTQLYRKTDLSGTGFDTTNGFADLNEVIGQPRAVDAIRFGTGIRSEGFNIFAAGPEGMDKRGLIRLHFESMPAKNRCRPTGVTSTTSPRSIVPLPSSSPQARALFFARRWKISSRRCARHWRLPSRARSISHVASPSPRIPRPPVRRLRVVAATCPRRRPGADPDARWRGCGTCARWGGDLA